MSISRPGDGDIIISQAHEWRLLLEDEATDDLRREFELWLGADERHASAYARAETLWDAFAVVDADRVRSSDSSSPARQRNWIQKVMENWRRPAILLPVASFAAVATLAVVTLITDLQLLSPAVPSQRYATDTGEVRVFILSDGSELTLGAASSIVVRMDEHSRNLIFERGAALFDVKPDPARPFSVAAGALTARALGTVFDVRLSAGVARVGVAEGSVEVNFAPDRSVAAVATEASQVLGAGEQIAASALIGMASAQPVAVDTIGAWRSGRLVYVAATVEEIVADARRHATYPIKLGPLDERTRRQRITASFDAHDVDSLVQTLPEIFPLTLEPGVPDGVYLRQRR
ncbi:MAG: FecR domain-containing protein [Pseudomonadota bacterium]